MLWERLNNSEVVPTVVSSSGKISSPLPRHHNQYKKGACPLLGWAGLREREHGVSELGWGTGSHSFWPDTGSVFNCPLSPPSVLDSKPGRSSSHSGLHLPTASRKPRACAFCGRVSTSTQSSTPPDPAPLLDILFASPHPQPQPCLEY